MALEISQVDDGFALQNSTAIKSMLNAAYEDDFSEEDWIHTFGGVRFLGMISGEIVAHGAIVPRKISINEELMVVGYLEGIAVSSNHQRQGVGRQLLSSITDFCRSEYQISMLSTDEFDFYGNLGWKRFSGKSGVLINSEVMLTPDEDEGLMYLIGQPGFTQEISSAYCDPREGDHW
jgi:aminoglycoside 2'-N-acetyltransferase I